MEKMGDSDRGKIRSDQLKIWKNSEKKKKHTTRRGEKERDDCPVAQSGPPEPDMEEWIRRTCSELEKGPTPLDISGLWNGERSSSAGLS